MKFLVLFMILFSLEAFAYIGPGVGLGAIGIVAALIGSFLVAFTAIVYYPIKRAYKKFFGEKRAL